jgi:sterol desaturase/sphingolipid hydroxylase (fatty acid hydroxylase superfamily)
MAIYSIFVESFVWNLIKFQDPVISATAWIFFLVGYMIYDISHYAFHFVDTTNFKGTWFHRLQKYHNRHHFSGEDAGFGVSTPLWDIILNTGYKKKVKN